MLLDDPALVVLVHRYLCETGYTRGPQRYSSAEELWSEYACRGYAYYCSYGVVMMTISAPERPAAIDPLTAARAGKELADLRLLRAVVRAREQGRSQSAIAAKLGLTQPGVHKMLIRAGVTPEVGERTPWEVVLGYAAGEMVREQMLATLAGWPWTVTSYPAEDGNPMSEVIERGSWEDVGRAVRAGYLSEKDYVELFERTA